MLVSNRWAEFFEDSTKQLSMHRLGAFIGIAIGSIVTIVAAILYYFSNLDATVFSDIWHTFLGITGGQYSLGKITDAFGKESSDDSVTEDATP